MEFQRNSIAINVSREMALDWGLVKPTPEEKVRRDAELESFRHRRMIANMGLPAALAALDDITDQPVRQVLDLHARRAEGVSWQCDGCDQGPYANDLPEWPCSTVELVAAHYGIRLPDHIMIERPNDGSLDWRRR